MKRNISKLVKWFCRRLTYNELASAIVILHEVLSGSRRDIELKPEPKPSEFRQFRADTLPPLEYPPAKRKFLTCSWRDLKRIHERESGRELVPVRRRKGALGPPEHCTCGNCVAPSRFLYLNDGKKASQVRCKICGSLSPTQRVRRESKASYWCPHCGNTLVKFRETRQVSKFKCQNYRCPRYLENLRALSPEAMAMRDAGKSSQFKLHYQYREYHLAPDDLVPARPELPSPVELGRIRNNYHTVSLILSFTVNLSLSSRQTRDALKGLFGISVSHQTVLNYAGCAAALLWPFADKHSPRPEPGTTAAADETYLGVGGEWHYSWFVIDSVSRAICGWNLSNNRETPAALATLRDAYGPPETNSGKTFEFVSDGWPAYDEAVMLYNQQGNGQMLVKNTVIGLKNLDPESTRYRPFKQLIERLNRTYKFHTRPRAGFKSFDGAVTLTVLFVTYYNFMRPHSARENHPPVKLKCLEGIELYPQMWTELLKQAAA